MEEIRWMSEEGLKLIVKDRDNGEAIDKNNIPLVLLYKIMKRLEK